MTLALVTFLAQPKPRVMFLGLSLLRNQTETLARQAISSAGRSGLLLSSGGWGQAENKAHEGRWEGKERRRIRATVEIDKELLEFAIQYQ